MPILTIPAQREGSAAFMYRLADLIRDESTHIYIDTSFLMWMTKVGSGSRQELVDWLQHNCVGRVHVPIWSAHEYLKHHVARTIVAELSAKTKEVDSIARRTYAYFRPFIDEPLGQGGEDPYVVRSEAIETLETLKRLNDKVGRWGRSYYDEHASEVISFINDHTPDQTFIYAELDNINQTGSGRFMGSVPPGYKDRWKAGGDRQSKRPTDGVPPDSNQYGDLIFWKEVLRHAKDMGASALVVITNDRKNDWYMGGSNTGDIDPTLRRLKREWKPVPEPHPMLVMEAKLVAKVKQVGLLDSAYLGALLREVAEHDVQAFADVAIIPDPDPERKGDEQAKLSEVRQESDAAALSTESTDKQYLFADSERVLNTRSHFQKALLESRNDIDQESEDLLRSWRTSVEGKLPLSETITSEALHDFDHRKLARLARELHDRILQHVSGYEEAMVGLVSILDLLPLNTAASLYLGLLASMYLCRKSNKSRIPPDSPVAKLLFDRQSCNYSFNGIEVVAKRLSDNEVKPLYLPNSKRPPVKFTLAIEQDAVTLDQLCSLTIQDAELLTPAQSEDSLRLGALFGGEGQTDGKAIIRKACELFAIPFEQVERTDMFDQCYSLTETVGFRRPSDIAIPKGQANGK